MSNDVEILEGYIVDLARIRKYPRAELAERARVHTIECATMGHCVESGYGLVDEVGGLALLDPATTPMVVDALRESDHNQGINLRAMREQRGEEMETTRVEETYGGHTVPHRTREHRSQSTPAAMERR